MEYNCLSLNQIADNITEKISLDDISTLNYISTENMIVNKEGVEEASKLPNTKKVNFYRKKDILVSNIRPYFKKIWQADNDGGASADVLIYRANQNYIDEEYLYYFLSQDSFFDFMVQTSKGTKMPRGDKNAIANYEVSFPKNIVYQRKVASIGRTIDEKIKLNKKTIANLEELSQTLFKRWFIDFEFQDKDNKPYKANNEEIETDNSGNLPKQWSIKKIKDIDCIVSDHVANGSFKSLKDNVHFTEKKEEQYALFARNIDLKSNLQNITKYVTKDTYQFLKKSRLFGGEVVISNVGDVGTIHRIPDIPVPMVLGNNQVFITSEEEYLNEYLYLYFKSHLGTHLINTITSGSAQMKFNKTDLRNSKLILPCKEDLNRLMKPLKIKLDYRDQLITENHKLTTLRDTLLPKLMSGEIELPDELEVDKHAELLQ